MATKKPTLTNDERRRRSERMVVLRDDPTLQERITAGLRANRDKFAGARNPMKRGDVRQKIRGSGNAMARPEVKAKHLAALRAYWATRRAKKASDAQ